MSFSPIDYVKRRMQYNTWREKIQEIVYNWGQQKPWDPKREEEATRLIGYLDTHLLIGIGHPDDPGPQGEMGIPGPDYKYSFKSVESPPEISVPYKHYQISEEERTMRLEQATINFIQDFKNKQIFTLEDEVKNGEI